MNGIKLLWEAVEKYKCSLNIGYYLVLVSLCWTKWPLVLTLWNVLYGSEERMKLVVFKQLEF
jgi:hypothetical protein